MGGTRRSNRRRETSRINFSDRPRDSGPPTVRLEQSTQLLLAATIGERIRAGRGRAPPLGFGFANTKWPGLGTVNGNVYRLLNRGSQEQKKSLVRESLKPPLFFSADDELASAMLAVGC